MSDQRVRGNIKEGNRMAPFKKIGILTSGGDAPGMNAAVYAVAEYAADKGIKVIGINEGYKGLLAEDFVELNADKVNNIIAKGGTVLNSARCPEFKGEEKVRAAVEICRKNGIEGIVAIGGDGTFRGATDLSNFGIPCIGLPGTIDNDITATDNSIGYDTAMNTVLEMCDRLRDTCESHARCNVVEVMGRNAGYIALNTGIALAATGVCIVEFDDPKYNGGVSNCDAIIERIKRRKAEGQRSFLVIVSEGLTFGEELTKRIEEETGVESRFARLSHVVRGGSPTLRDRVMACRMACAAVELLLEGKSNMVVCERNGKISSLEINYALATDKLYKSRYAGYKKVDEDALLSSYTDEQKEAMDTFCKNRFNELKELYDIAVSLAN